MTRPYLCPAYLWNPPTYPPKPSVVRQLQPSYYPSVFLADTGKARGCSTNSVLIDLLSKFVAICAPQLYGAAKPEQLGMVPSVKK